MPPPDTGAVRTAQDAAGFAAQASPLPGGPPGLGAVQAAAASGFARTTAALGAPPIASAPAPTLLDRFELPDPRDDPRREQRRPRPGSSR